MRALPAKAAHARWPVGRSSRDRWQQLLFGFYPPELYWRPVLALSCSSRHGADPVDNLPRKMLILTLAAPFLCFWLLWGGSIWAPIVVALGFVLGWAIIKFGSDVSGNLVAMIAAVLIPIVFWLFAAGPLVSVLSSIAAHRPPIRASRDFGGFMLAVVIGVSGIVLSMPLGILLALGRQSDLFIINKMLGDLHRGDPGRAADRLAVHRLAAAELLPAAGNELRPDAAGDHHGDAVLVGLYRRSRPRWSGGVAKGPIRGRRQSGARTTGSPCG